MSSLTDKPAYDLSNLRILVIEDSHFMQLLLLNVLKQLGIWDIYRASDGADAFVQMKLVQPDIIVCDWEMEVLDGIEVTRLIRTGKDSPDPFVPIIMLTAHTEESRVVTARDAGISEYLAKPVSAKALYERIVGVIEHPRSFVRSDTYFGPDRRRTPPTEATNKGRRKEDKRDTENAVPETGVSERPERLSA